MVEKCEINDVVFDEEAKELLIVTNLLKGAPLEAMALRVVNFEKKRPVLAWTYRRVNGARLHFAAPGTAEKWRKGMARVLKARQSRYFAGRV